MCDPEKQNKIPGSVPIDIPKINHNCRDSELNNRIAERKNISKSVLPVTTFRGQPFSYININYKEEPSVILNEFNYEVNESMVKGFHPTRNKSQFIGLGVEHPNYSSGISSQLSSRNSPYYRPSCYPEQKEIPESISTTLRGSDQAAVEKEVQHIFKSKPVLSSKSTPVTCNTSPVIFQNKNSVSMFGSPENLSNSKDSKVDSECMRMLKLTAETFNTATSNFSDDTPILLNKFSSGSKSSSGQRSLLSSRGSPAQSQRVGFVSTNTRSSRLSQNSNRSSHLIYENYKSLQKLPPYIDENSLLFHLNQSIICFNNNKNYKKTSSIRSGYKCQHDHLYCQDLVDIYLHALKCQISARSSRNGLEACGKPNCGLIKRVYNAHLSCGRTNRSVVSTNVGNSKISGF